MKKTNLMLDVSEEVYTNLVEPFKKQRKFNTLIGALLDGYMYNDSINSYINGVLDGVEKEATNELLKDLASMQNSLNEFSFLTQEAENIISNGQRDFKNTEEKAIKDIKPAQDEGVISKAEFNNALKSVFDSMDEMFMKSNSKYENQLKQMEQNIQSMLINKTVEIESTRPNDSVVEETKVVRQKAVITEEEQVLEENTTNTEVAEDVAVTDYSYADSDNAEEDEDDDAVEALASLMNSIQY